MLPRRINELEEILDISKKDERVKALKRLADELGMLPKSAVAINEQKLVLAIYDGFLSQEKRIKKRSQNLFLLFCCSLVLVIVLITFPKMFTQYFRHIELKNKNRLKTYSALDEDGKVVKDDNGNPATFKDMDGYYDEYYNDGVLHFEYLYKEGRVAEQKEFDHNGKILAHFVFDESGEPILVQGE